MTRPRILVATEQRCWLDSRGDVLGRQAVGALLDMESQADLVVMARATSPEPDGLGILPGAAACLLNEPLVRPGTLATIWRKVATADVVVVPCPGVLGGITSLAAMMHRTPLIALVVGDGRQVARALAPNFGARRFALEAIHSVSRFVVRRASIARYVTREHLQTVYPPGRRTKVFALTDAQPNFTTTKPRPAAESEHLRLITVGTLDQPYKGIADIISAVRRLRSNGLEVELTVVGEGRLMPELVSMGQSEAPGACNFVGGRYGDELRQLLMTHDLYVQGSHTEGLSRVVVEALSLGIPVVATDVGGTADVVAQAGLFPPRDIAQLADTIEAHIPVSRRQALLDASRELMVESLDNGEEVRTNFRRAIIRLASGGPVPRVLHIFGVMDRGGAEMRTIELTAGLLPEVDPHFMTLRGRPGTLDGQIKNMGGRVHPTPLRATFAWDYFVLLRRVRPDVVDSHVATFSGALLLLARLAGVPRRIAHFRSDGDDHGNSLRRRAQRLFMRSLIDRNATDIIGVSPSSLEFGYRQDWANDPRCRVIPSGIRTKRNTFEHQSLRERFCIPDDALLLMHVGRPSPEKNRVRLPSILSTLNLHVPAHIVLVGGEGPDRNLLEAAIIDEDVSDQVHHLGSVDDVTNVLSQADILVQPSFREGLPGAVLEAASVGTPVLSSDVPGAQWIARTLPRVHTLSLSAGNEIWADAVLDAIRSATSRETAVRLFEESDFNFEASLAEHAALWQPR